MSKNLAGEVETDIEELTNATCLVIRWHDKRLVENGPDPLALSAVLDRANAYILNGETSGEVHGGAGVFADWELVETAEPDPGRFD